MKLSKNNFKVLFIIILIMVIIPFLVMLNTKLNEGGTLHIDNINVDIKGVVKDITNINSISAILVEDSSKTSKYDSALVTIDSDTIILKRSDNKEYSASDIKVGNNLEIEFMGTVRESYPVQATAKIIYID